MDKEQEPNLTEPEDAGMKSLQRKDKKEELIIMKKDKFGKLAITDKECTV